MNKPQSDQQSDNPDEPSSNSMPELSSVGPVEDPLATLDPTLQQSDEVSAAAEQAQNFIGPYEIIGRLNWKRGSEMISERGFRSLTL